MNITEVLAVGYRIRILSPNEIDDGVWTLRLLVGGDVAEEQRFGRDIPTQDQIERWIRSVFNRSWEDHLVRLLLLKVNDIFRALTVQSVRTG